MVKLWLFQTYCQENEWELKNLIKKCIEMLYHKPVEQISIFPTQVYEISGFGKWNGTVSHSLHLPSVFMVEVPPKKSSMEKLDWKLKLSVY